MTGYELMRNLYPQWYPDEPFHPLMKIFLAIVILLIIPYIYTKFIECRIIAGWKRFRPRWHGLSI